MKFGKLLCMAALAGLVVTSAMPVCADEAIISGEENAVVQSVENGNAGLAAENSGEETPAEEKQNQPEAGAEEENKEADIEKEAQPEDEKEEIKGKDETTGKEKTEDKEEKAEDADTEKEKTETVLTEKKEKEEALLGDGVSEDSANEPTYTVTIPTSLTLSDEGTALEIKASDVKNMDGKKVSVTINGTNYFRNQMVLKGTTSKSSYSSTMRYQLIAADGTVIETTGTDTATGAELAAFTEDGTVTYTAKPVASTMTNIETGVEYSGTMTFGISVTE